MKIDLIAGARPNFIKIAPIIHELNKINTPITKMSFRLIHTGQHYDKNMSDSFFKQLEIPDPDFNLKSGSGTQAEQTAKIMIEYEKLLINSDIDLCLVVGDVNSTMACAIVAKKLNVKVAHVEAGIRSDDLTMPEEINRMVTDSITDYFFTTTELAINNLKKIGVNKSNIFFVGNTMIDTLIKQKENFYAPKVWEDKSLQKNKYLVITLHRPSNVDQQNKLKETMEAIVNNSRNIPIVFPVHPRTKDMLDDIGVNYTNLHFTEPLSYLEFNYLVNNSKAVITDSGGITEETTVMGIPCLTLRDNTERPETVEIGTNVLVGTNPRSIKTVMDILFDGKWKRGGIPKFWDGKTSKKIVKHLIRIGNNII